MHYKTEDINAWDRILRLKIINSITGIKPANLIGTVDKDGQSNLAIFSSVVHLGSRPALIGCITRPQTADVGHTLSNILETGVYTINHIHPEFTKNAHFTSTKFDKTVSEFEACGLNEEYISGVSVPFVKESTLKVALKFVQVIDLPNGTKLLIGEVSDIILPDIDLNGGDLDLELTRTVGISGLNSYYSLNKITQYPYARLENLPDFDG